MDINTLYHRTVESWTDRVSGVKDEQWDDPTPCSEWTVRELVNHVVGEDRWTTPLMRGRTIEEVGTDLDGDLLGDDPIGNALRAAGEATTVVAELLPTGGKVNLSYGPEDVAEYVHQLAADHLVHGWDLAAATGGDRDLEEDLMRDLGEWFAEREELYRSAGLVGPRLDASGDLQTELLAAAGRDARWTPPKP